MQVVAVGSRRTAEEWVILSKGSPSGVCANLQPITFHLVLVWIAVPLCRSANIFSKRPINLYRKRIGTLLNAYNVLVCVTLLRRWNLVSLQTLFLSMDCVPFVYFWPKVGTWIGKQYNLGTVHLWQIIMWLREYIKRVKCFFMRKKNLTQDEKTTTFLCRTILFKPDPKMARIT